MRWGPSFGEAGEARIAQKFAASGRFTRQISEMRGRLSLSFQFFHKHVQEMRSLSMLFCHVCRLPAAASGMKVVLQANSDQFANYMLCLDLLCQIKSVIFAESICSEID